LGQNAENYAQVIASPPAETTIHCGAALAWTQKYFKGEGRVDRGAELLKHAASENFDEALRI
jgi:hypothetical protein